MIWVVELRSLIANTVSSLLLLFEIFEPIISINTPVILYNTILHPLQFISVHVTEIILLKYQESNPNTYCPGALYFSIILRKSGSLFKSLYMG